jgi:hypothetical protein
MKRVLKKIKNNFKRSFTAIPKKKSKLILFSLISLPIGIYLLNEHHHYNATETIPGVTRKDLPNYKKEEIQKHKTKETRIWVIYFYFLIKRLLIKMVFMILQNLLKNIQVDKK